VSRDSIGDEERSPWRAPRPGAPSSPPEAPTSPSTPPPAVPPVSSGPTEVEDGVTDDLDGPPADPGRTPPTDGGPRGVRALLRPGGRRAVGLLVVGALLGAAGTGLAVRARDADRVALAAGESWGSGLVPGDTGDLIQVNLVLVNTGDEDVEVVGGGVGRDERVEGEVSQLRPGRAVPDGGAVVPAAGSAYLNLSVTASCDDLPAWEPWVRVRTAGGGTPVVDLPAVDTGIGFGGVGGDPLSQACVDLPPTTTPSVVGAEVGAEGVLSVTVDNATDVAYTVAVDEPGPLGVALEAGGGGAVVEPGQTTVRLTIAPPDCDAALALGVEQLVPALVARRSDDAGTGPGESFLFLDPYSTGTGLGVALGRACPGDPESAPAGDGEGR